MTEATATVEDAPGIAGSIPATNNESASEADEKERRPRKNKPKCPFLIEKWNVEIDENDLDNGYWSLVLDKGARDLDSTAKAETWAEKNLEAGDYRIIQNRSAFTIKTEEIKKSTIIR